MGYSNLSRIIISNTSVSIHIILDVSKWTMTAYLDGFYSSHWRVPKRVLLFWSRLNPKIYLSTPWNNKCVNLGHNLFSNLMGWPADGRHNVTQYALGNYKKIINLCEIRSFKSPFKTNIHIFSKTKLKIDCITISS